MAFFPNIFSVNNVFSFCLVKVATSTQKMDDNVIPNTPQTPVSSSNEIYAINTFTIQSIPRVTRHYVQIRAPVPTMPRSEHSGMLCDTVTFHGALTQNVLIVQANRKKTIQKAIPKKAKTPSKKPAKRPNTLSSAEKRKRHRLSQAHVRLERINLPADETPHRTRSALVAEFKEKNIMTRNRHSLDRIKSTTQRVEHLKKIAPNALSQQGNNRSAASAAIPTQTRRTSAASSISIPPASSTAQNNIGASKSPLKQSARTSKVSSISFRVYATIGLFCSTHSTNASFSINENRKIRNDHRSH